MIMELMIMALLYKPPTGRVMQMLRLCIVFFTGALLTGPVSEADDLLDKYRAPAIEKWSAEMERIKALDAQEKDPSDAVLFIGSSSIRLWSDIASDMHPWPVIQ